MWKKDQKRQVWKRRHAAGLQEAEDVGLSGSSTGQSCGQTLMPPWAEDLASPHGQVGP